MTSKYREREFGPDWFRETFIQIFEERVEQNWWRKDAACLGKDPGLWHALPTEHAKQREAIAICASCPVRVECGEANLSQRVGIWGGAGENKRRKIRRERQKVAA